MTASFARSALFVAAVAGILVLAGARPADRPDGAGRASNDGVVTAAAAGPAATKTPTEPDRALTLTGGGTGASDQAAAGALASESATSPAPPGAPPNEASNDPAAAVAGSAAVASPPTPVTTAVATADPAGARVGDLADPCTAMQAAVTLQPPAGWFLECHGARTGIMGETSPSRQVVIMYLRPEWTIREAARIYGHELGHAYDFAVLTDADRQQWTAQRGLPPNWNNWCPAGSTCGDLDRPAGDWAEAVGEALVPGTGMWAGALAGPPTPEDLEVLRGILAGHGAVL